MFMDTSQTPVVLKQFWWPIIDRDMREYVKACVVCA